MSLKHVLAATSLAAGLFAGGAAVAWAQSTTPSPAPSTTAPSTPSTPSTPAPTTPQPSTPGNGTHNCPNMGGSSSSSGASNASNASMREYSPMHRSVRLRA